MPIPLLAGLAAKAVGGGLLKGLFKKKPGGTFVGNLMRKGASKLFGGGRPQTATAQMQIPNVRMQMQAGGGDSSQQQSGGKFMDFLKKYGGYIAAGVGTIIALVVALMPRKRRRR